MTFSLEFDQRALKEWHKLGDTIRQQFKKKLAEILVNPGRFTRLVKNTLAAKIAVLAQEIGDRR